MAGLVQTIAVVDKSGKAISSVGLLLHIYQQFIDKRQSKHLVSVWKEAKAAYLDRKAEVAANRKDAYRGSGSGQRVLKESKDRHRSAPSSPTHHHHHSSSQQRPSTDRHRSSISIHSGSRSSRAIYPESSHRHSQDLHSTTSPMPGIRRSQTADDDVRLVQRHRLPARSMTSPSSANDIDMGLAYGDLPPSPRSRSASPEQRELQPLVGKVARLLEEADCLQHSATATMTSLQKNPEAMAAVALALAELSNLLRKMAPTALVTLRNSAPAVFSLLISPQFLIAGGVAVGLTVVAFGGYKIIKRIKASEGLDKEQSMDEMIEVGGDVGRIEDWRRGVAESDLESLSGTSVEGELITPHAHALSKLNLAENNRQHARKHKSESNGGSSRGSGSHRKERTVESSSKVSSKKSGRTKMEKSKKPSPLRLMFH